MIPAIGLSATIQVPGDYLAIQEAIDAAKDGDTVLVHPGTYVENIDFKGKAITVKSTDGPDSTTIDGGMKGSVVTFVSDEGNDSVLDGFFITNGSGTYYPGWSGYLGGGIYCDLSCPTISNNVIDGNSADNGGGVACFNNSDAIISNNTISWNDAAFYHGGGILCNQSCPTISNNTISNNSCVRNGGGIICRVNSHAEIVNNLIKDNTAGWPGGGIFISIDSSTMVLDNIISGNDSIEGGAGMFCCKNSAPTISGNVITENTASGINGCGGGILFNNSLPLICNNIIAGNTATWYCGGIGAWTDCHITAVNNTVCNNTAGLGGSGLEIWDYSSATVINTVFWDNTGQAEIYLEQNASADIDYSDVEGGMESLFKDGSSTIIWGLHMIDADPLFVDSGNNDFHLTWLSPCINMGTDDGAPDEDFEGEARPHMGTADMGADEFTGTHSLSADLFTLSATAGGQVVFDLYAGPDNANRKYMVLGSVTGKAPGFPLPGGQATLLLNWDPFTNMLVELLNTVIFQNFMGTLDGNGTASSIFVFPAPNPGAAGLTMSYAYALNGPWNFASNPIDIEITP
jgi:nitrous oxidase accessory protein NosD